MNFLHVTESIILVYIMVLRTSLSVEISSIPSYFLKPYMYVRKYASTVARKLYVNILLSSTSNFSNVTYKKFLQLASSAKKRIMFVLLMIPKKNNYVKTFSMIKKFKIT